MKIVYYPVPVPTAVHTPPWSASAWETAPRELMDTAKLAMALAKDIDPCGAVPLLTTGGLMQVFASMYPAVQIDGHKMLVAHKEFSRIPGNWIRVFSELAAAATSLAVAEHIEGYPFCLSMQFCKAGASAPVPGPGVPPWPAAYLAAIPTDWHIEPTSPDLLMPDYVIARQDHRGFFEFATLESKGRNAPVDSTAYPNFSAHKAQSKNAKLVAKKGKSPPPPPPLSRNILSLVAIRPKLKTERGRALRCRWANHRPDDVRAEKSASDHIGLRFAAASYAVQLHNTGFRELADAVARCLVDRDDLALAYLRGEPAQLGLVPRGGNLFGLGARESTLGEVLIPSHLLEILRLLCQAVQRADAAFDRRIALHLSRRNTWASARPQIVIGNGKTRGARRVVVSRSVGGLAIVSELS